MYLLTLRLQVKDISICRDYGTLIFAFDFNNKIAALTNNYKCFRNSSISLTQFPNV